MSREWAEEALGHIFISYAKPANLETGSLSFPTFTRLAEETALLIRLTPRERSKALERLKPPSTERIRFKDFILIVGLIATLSDRRLDPETAFLEAAQRMLQAFMGKYPHKIPAGLHIPVHTDSRPTTVVRQAATDHSHTSLPISNGTRSMHAASIKNTSVANISEVSQADHSTSSHGAPSVRSASYRASETSDGPSHKLSLSTTAYIPHGLTEAIRLAHAYMTSTGCKPEEFCELLRLSPVMSVIFEPETMKNESLFWEALRPLGRVVIPWTQCPIVAEEMAFQHIFNQVMLLDIACESDFVCVE